ncbi:haloacid dehalogenase-like hydrolase [Legionella bononiensis]|uniref:phosphoserine phosphatase n=1 Tax=Legionella bononiensis TaxID=2793102 RepID=A0ABS1WD41_9GAMM|nr:haloacid dehalogenase-like hydrolase [Legionella bononiensis]MBL7479137.1 haloacid dehalogenase-like hydrolase [Legionella bononiensis]MBL7527270.1 haloacid dehalogenase-like hydrolase [Legionella bononiensis]MBL7562239.1 haloacid dehalogenase-like hydrolase [Legionella bononiensis]
MSRTKTIYLLFTVLSSFSFAVFSSNSITQLIPENEWFGTNSMKLNAIIKQYGINSPGYQVHRKPVAAFDWDNTMMKNDIGDATLLWMVSHGTLKRNSDFKQMNPWLTSDALNELEKNCGGKSEYLPTRQNPACADTLMNIYHNQSLENGATAWHDSPDPERIVPTYFFYAQLFAGYTPDEITEFTKRALDFNLANNIGATQKVGSKDYPAYVRIYKPMNHLVSVLQQNGFDVWIISASIQPSVEVVAKRVGIRKDHVIGVRHVLNEQGQLTDRFQGCGTFPDGNKEIISNRIGKRCWLNKVVFKLRAEEQLYKPTPIIFAAGDSAGDRVFLRDALGGRLVINKNNPELLCDAVQNSDGKWLINPMFIKPVPFERTLKQC